MLLTVLTVGWTGNRRKGRQCWLSLMKICPRCIKWVTPAWRECRFKAFLLILSYIRSVLRTLQVEWRSFPNVVGPTTLVWPVWVWMLETRRLLSNTSWRKEEPLLQGSEITQFSSRLFKRRHSATYRDFVVGAPALCLVSITTTAFKWNLSRLGFIRRDAPDEDEMMKYVLSVSLVPVQWEGSRLAAEDESNPHYPVAACPLWGYQYQYQWQVPGCFGNCL